MRSLCTDGDGVIGKMMREDYGAIEHALDFWHVIKPIKKALRQVTIMKPIRMRRSFRYTAHGESSKLQMAKLKRNPNIKFWKQRIINHLYYAHRKYPTDRKRAIELMLSVLPHVVGRHRFIKVPFYSRAVEE